MKFGPVHLIRDVTFRRLREMQCLWERFSAALASATQSGNPLAGRVAEHTHGLLHSPLCSRLAPVMFTPAPSPEDAEELHAAERVVAAYHYSIKESAEPPAPSMWDRIGGEKASFITALTSREVRTVSSALGRMFASELNWGLGQVHPSHVELLRSPGPTHLHERFADTVVNLAEAVGAARITHMIQDPAGHLHPLDRDLDALMEATATRLGFDPSFPVIGSAFGFRVAGKLATIDSLTHAYNAYRLHQLGAGANSSAFEIGGGYGCLALMACRAGMGRYTIFDLPWVNALQGYFLIRSLPEWSVQLHGEGTGDIRVLPYWKLRDEPARSCDLLANTDSLPEMGYATAKGYLNEVRRVTRGCFLSINQEAKAEVPGVGPQQCVAELADEVGGLAIRSRQRYWMRQGYVEEVYEPVR